MRETEPFVTIAARLRELLEPGRVMARVRPRRSADVSGRGGGLPRARRGGKWRRRLLPLGGIVAMLLVWAALVYVFEVPRFIAPSPQLVAQTLVPNSTC